MMRPRRARRQILEMERNCLRHLCTLLLNIALRVASTQNSKLCSNHSCGPNILYLWLLFCVVVLRRNYVDYALKPGWPALTNMSCACSFIFELRIRRIRIVLVEEARNPPCAIRVMPVMTISVSCGHQPRHARRQIREMERNCI